MYQFTPIYAVAHNIDTTQPAKLPAHTVTDAQLKAYACTTAMEHAVPNPQHADNGDTIMVRACDSSTAKKNNTLKPVASDPIASDPIASDPTADRATHDPTLFMCSVTSISPLVGRPLAARAASSQPPPADMGPSSKKSLNPEPL
jgi:hypothetical protein